MRYLWIIFFQSLESLSLKSLRCGFFMKFHEYFFLPNSPSLLSVLWISTVRKKHCHKVIRLCCNSYLLFTIDDDHLTSTDSENSNSIWNWQPLHDSKSETSHTNFHNSKSENEFTSPPQEHFIIRRASKKEPCQIKLNPNESMSLPQAVAIKGPNRRRTGKS